MSFSLLSDELRLSFQHQVNRFCANGGLVVARSQIGNLKYTFLLLASSKLGLVTSRA